MDYDAGKWRREDATPEGARIQIFNGTAEFQIQPIGKDKFECKAMLAPPNYNPKTQFPLSFITVPADATKQPDQTIDGQVVSVWKSVLTPPAGSPEGPQDNFAYVDEKLNAMLRVE